jgi:ankyrin repeat protein
VSDSPLLDAIRRDDPKEVARVLDAHPELRARLDDPLPGYSFGQTALMAAAHRGNRDVMDVLLRAGADINRKSHWWAGPFHVLDGSAREPWLPSFLIGRGAVPEIHHLVQLGMAVDVRRALAEDPNLILARGGDGQMPLHFAQTVDMADYLLNRGADINARDIDHESTAAQYMVRDRQPVARFLVRRGAQADVLMAAALGDVELASRLLDADPAVIRTRVSKRWFPMLDRRAGGTIYIWALGGEKGAHEIAREFGHQDVFDELMARTPPSLRLAVACQTGDEALAGELRARGTAIDREDHVWLLAAASRDLGEIAQRLLAAGWPGDVVEGSVTALHWAAWNGDAALVSALLRRGARRDVKDPQFSGTPRDWAEHAAANRADAGGRGYAATLDLLRDEAL